jgi:phosphatidylinositol alpha-mannosyltransferase
VLLRAWPEIHAATGARLRLIGTDPLQYRLLHARMRFDEAGIDVLGIVPNDVRTHELERAKVSVTPALGGESFGLVLAEAFACATPAVASDIPGYAAVAIPEAATLVPPDDPDKLAAAVIAMLGDEERRVEMGRAARAHALANYAWDDIARRLEETYLEVVA